MAREELEAVFRRLSKKKLAADEASSDRCKASINHLCEEGR